MFFRGLRCNIDRINNVVLKNIFSIFSYKMGTKMKVTLVVLLVITAVVSGAPQEAASSSSTPDDKSYSDLVSKSLRRFTRELYTNVSLVENGNFVFSPYSLHLAFSLLAMGAPEGSPTRKELVCTLPMPFLIFKIDAK